MTPPMSKERRAEMKERRIHTCSICGAEGVWTDSWSWYGSIADIEGTYRGYKMVKGPRPVTKFCSDKCKEEHGFRLNPT